MKLKTFVLISVLSTCGTMAAAGPLDLSTGSAGFANTPITGSFLDTYTFTVVSPVIASGSITSVVNGTQDIDFSQITVTGPAGSFAFTQVLGDPFETWALNPAALLPGLYTFSIAGANSAAGASYGGNFAVSAQVAAVPEPGTIALMLAGLGGVGLFHRRKRVAA